MTASFGYDVAFSLLDIDEPSAKKIAALLAPLKVFLYSERQLELVGADGVQLFAQVFKRDSRTVAIFYRDLWGKTKWTAFEEGAIRDRVLNDGPDFVTLISLDGATPPTWFPESRIWADFTKLGDTGVAAVLKERAAQRGTVLRVESAEEVAARIAARKVAEADRIGFLRSTEAEERAKAEARLIIDGVTAIGPKIGAAVTQQPPHGVMIYRDGFTVIVYSAELSNGPEFELVITEWSGRPSFGGHRFASVAREQRVHTLRFDRPQPGEFAWRNEGDASFMSSDRVIDWVAKLLLSKLER